MRNLLFILVKKIVVPQDELNLHSMIQLTFINADRSMLLF